MNRPISIRFPTVLSVALVCLVLLVAGCTKKDETVFYVDQNFEDRAKVLQVVQYYLDGVNGQDLSTLSRSFVNGFVMPDAQVVDRVHSRQSILDGFAAFFRRATDIEYKVDDVFVKLAENSARIDFKLFRCYQGHAPFVHDVNDVDTETIYLKPDEFGIWRFSTIPHRMLPPELAEI